MQACGRSAGRARGRGGGSGRAPARPCRTASGCRSRGPGRAGRSRPGRRGCGRAGRRRRRGARRRRRGRRSGRRGRRPRGRRPRPTVTAIDLDRVEAERAQPAGDLRRAVGGAGLQTVVDGDAAGAEAELGASKARAEASAMESAPPEQATSTRSPGGEVGQARGPRRTAALRCGPMPARRLCGPRIATCTAAFAARSTASTANGYRAGQAPGLAQPRTRRPSPRVGDLRLGRQGVRRRPHAVETVHPDLARPPPVRSARRRGTGASWRPCRAAGARLARVGRAALRRRWNFSRISPTDGTTSGPTPSITKSRVPLEQGHHAR